MASFFPTAGVLFWRIRVRLRSNIEDILREAKYRFCPHCQYDLTGLDPSGICPECGRRFSPDLLGVMWLSKIDRW
jgi:predicted amidophosphoribosyltransferase